MLSQEKAVEEIAAIYKLAGLSWCFVIWDINTSHNPQLHIVDPTESSDKTQKIVAFSLALIAPLYNAMMTMISIAGIHLATMNPIGWDSHKASVEYMTVCLKTLRKWTIEKFYQQHIEDEEDIPDAAKEIILKILAPLTNI